MPTESRYDLPQNPGPGLHEPIGHAVVMIGFDNANPQQPIVRFIDPADNLVDGKGIHIWDSKPAAQKLRVTESELLLRVGNRDAKLTAAVIAGITDAQAAVPPSLYEQTDMPDLSQHVANGWTNYCAPTAAADVVFFLASRYPSLLQDPEGPSGKFADDRATALIAGLHAPPSSPGSLSGMMGTSTTTGTSPANLRKGLAEYLSTHGKDPLTDWKTTVIDGGNGRLTPTDFWRRLCKHTASDSGVVLLLQWVSRSATDVADRGGAGPDGRQSSDPGTGTEARANGVDHSIPPSPSGTRIPNPKKSPSSRGADKGNRSEAEGPDRSRKLSPGPQPSSRSRVENRPPIDGVIPDAPEVSKLPDLQDLLGPTGDVDQGQAARSIIGRWRQVEGASTADFAEGGYRTSELNFRPDGKLIINLVFDTRRTISLVRVFAYKLRSVGILELSRSDKHILSASIKRQVVLPSDAGKTPVTIVPAAVRVPTRLSIRIYGNRLQIGQKIYNRAQ